MSAYQLAQLNIARLLATVFPNAANVWWLWLLLAPPALAARWATR